GRARRGAGAAPRCRRVRAWDDSRVQEGSHATAHAWQLSALHPMRAWTSMTGSTFNGATPSAIANATIPSIRPTERFFEGLRLPASSTAITVLLAHIDNTG